MPPTETPAVDDLSQDTPASGEGSDENGKTLSNDEGLNPYFRRGVFWFVLLVVVIEIAELAEDRSPTNVIAAGLVFTLGAAVLIWSVHRPSKRPRRRG